MMQLGARSAREIWLVDFEFSAPQGKRPSVVCLVAWEYLSGKRLRLWEDELYAMSAPPYATDENAVVVA